ncbi:MAG: hypothetical protein ACD_19C00146G0001 [uncultured bacterium]|nr:MAG: hypothetical protein ACD_19C00146G0001 [uncultured bacterium]
MTNKKRKILAVATVLIVAILLFLKLKQKYTPVYTETFLNPTSEELESYRNVYKQEPVKYLRKALNAYLANNSDDACIVEPAVMGGEPPKDLANITTGLSSFEKKIYKSKFVVLSYLTPENSGYGDDMYHIQILFQDYPHRVFYTTLGKFQDDDICLLGFGSDEEMTGFKLQETLLPLKNFLDYEDLAI